MRGFLLAAAILGPPPSSPQDDAAAIAAGRASLDRNDPAEALRHFSSVLARKPEEPGALQGVARSLLLLGRFEEALVPLDRYARAVPDHAGVRTMRGYVHHRIGKAREAEADLRRAIELQPESAGAYAVLAQVLRGTSRTDESVGLLRKGIERCPRDAEIRQELGESLALLGRDREAEPEFREALALDPGRVEARFRLGTVLERGPRPGEAIAEWERVVREKPSHRGAWYRLARAYAAAGRAEEGRAALARFREISTLEERQEALRNRLKAYPGDLAARFELAEALLSLGEPAAAIGWLIDLPDDPATRGRTLALFGRAELALRHFESAAAILARAKALAPEDLSVRLDLARSHLGARRLGPAAEEVREVLARSPGNAGALALETEIGALPATRGSGR
ncbi:MAG: tetratricopeptide repeat protein [Planctomycetes bacterium]|nr:tetratricopeptide repeat protein [Planctomycetota bacterium]